MKLDLTAVVAAAKAGDKKARDVLMSRFYAWSVTQAKRVLGDTDDACNVAVDFWEWLYSKDGFDHFEPAGVKGDFFAWMGLCIKRRAKDASIKRKPKVVYSSTLNDPGNFEEDPLARLSAIEDVESVANTLRSPVQKEIFWRLLQGVTVADM